VNARKSLISLLPLFSLIKVTSVFAHNYLPADPGSTFTKIPDISVSRAAYRELGRIGQVDVYEFDAKKGQEIYIQMTIPQIEALKEFAPRFDAVFPQGSDSKVPPPLGVAYDGSDPLPFDEPFTGTKYWIRQTLTVAAPVDGTYRIGVYAEDQQIGKYVLAPGRKEQFGIGDVFALPAVRWNVRVFCREPVWPDALFWSVLGAAAVAGIGVGIYYAVPH
jgi:hypothetical protein